MVDSDGDDSDIPMPEEAEAPERPAASPLPPELPPTNDSLVVLDRNDHKFPPVCCLCLSPTVTHWAVASVTVTVNYVVVRRRREWKVEGVPYCEACRERMQPTTSEHRSSLVGLVAAGIAWLAIFLYTSRWGNLGNSFCWGLMGAVAVALIIGFAMRLVVRDKSQQAGLTLWLGKDRFGFAFRNAEYANRFAALNAVSIEKLRCGKCSDPIVDRVTIGVFEGASGGETRCVSCGTTGPPIAPSKLGLENS